MWINNNISKPLRKGNYKTLVDFDGLGNLIEMEDELFNGVDWDLYNSSVQFVSFWWSEKEDYNTIADKIEKENKLNFTRANQLIQLCKKDSQK